ncbi:MAG: hypothetical protein LBG12_00260 [Synergistaceae bacterium]|nr:hypothetical protein [Synergistaceae bacterium]
MNPLKFSVIAFLILIATTASFADAISGDAGWDNFRARDIKNNLTEWNGISWSDAPERLGENGILTETSGDMTSYVVRGETAALGGVEIGEIKYRFKTGKLAALDFICASPAENARAEEYAIKRFGPPQKMSEEENILYWSDESYAIYLVNNPGERALLRFIHSRKTNKDFAFSFRNKRIKNMPDGFGGLRWKDSPEALEEDLILIDADNAYRRSCYKKPEENPYLGRAVEKALYFFINRRFECVQIYFKKSNSEESLRLLTSEHFGNAMVISADERLYIWGDDEFIVSLEIFEGGGGMIALGTNIEWDTTKPRGGNWTYSASAEFGGGSGTEKDPFLITTPEQLARLAVIANRGDSLHGTNFKLVSDIDLWEREWTPIGVLKDFNGKFDGDGHTVLSLRMSSETPFSNLGLFGGVGKDGSVKNLILREAVISITVSDKTSKGIGGIAASNFGKVTDCFASIVASADNSAIGGIVGHNGGSIENCSADAVLRGNLGTGGVAAMNAGLVEKCSVYTTISGSGMLGGLVGFNFNGVVDNCKASGTARGDMGKTFAGGIVGFNLGFNSDDGLIKNCEADNVASGRVAGGVAGVSDAKRVTDCSYNEGRYSKSALIGRRQPFYWAILTKFIKMDNPLGGNMFLIKATGVSLIAAAALIAVFIVFRALKRQKQPTVAGKHHIS